MKQTIIPIFLTVALLAACGDDGSSTSANKGGTDFAFEEETLDDLPNCTAEYEQSTAFIKDGKKIYVCDAGKWEFSSRLRDSVLAEKDLPDCTEKIDGDSAYVNADNTVRLCRSERWLVLGESVANRDSLRNCTSTREGAWVFLENEGATLVCSDGKWTPFDVKDLEPESSSSVSPESSSDKAASSSSVVEFSSSEETSSSSLKVEESSSSVVESSSSSAVLESSSSVVESSSSSSLASSSSAVPNSCSVSFGDILCENGMFILNGTAVGKGWSLQAYKEDMEADQSADYDSSAFGVVSVISDDEGVSVLEFKTSVTSSFTDIWMLQAFYDGITLEKGFSYQIQANGYKYANPRIAYLGVYVPSLDRAPLTFDFRLDESNEDWTASSESYTHCDETVPARFYIDGLIGPYEPYKDMPDEDWEYGFAIRWVKLIKKAASCN